MKKVLFSLSLLAMMCTSCQPDVDLANVDLHAEVGVGLSLPIGNINVTIGDLLGDSALDMLYIDADHRLVLGSQFSVSKKFQEFDIASMIPELKDSYDLYESLGGYPSFPLPISIPVHLDIPLNAKLEGFNQPDAEHRLDSALFSNAMMSCNISTNSIIQESWVTKLQLILQDGFTRVAGDTINVFEGSGFKFNQNIPLTFDNFSLCLMKNRHPQTPAEYENNTIDSCKMTIAVDLLVPAGTTISVQPGDEISYKLKINQMDYTALWGFFEPSNQMSDADIVPIFAGSGLGDLFNRLSLPFAQPSLSIKATTQIAGALVVHGDYLYIKDGQKNDSVFATFDEAQTVHTFDTHFEEGTPSSYCQYDNGYLPINSTIGDSARMPILFNEQWQNGHIDNLFTMRPDYLGYKFGVWFDKTKTPQLRLSANTGIRLDADMTIPFTFNEGLQGKLDIELKDLNLSDLRLDSLLANIKIIDSIEDSHLTMAMTIENKIPLHLAGVCRFYDKNGMMVMDPNDPTKPFSIGSQDTLQFALPTIVYDGAQSTIGEPGTSIFSIEIDQKDFAVLSTISTIKMGLTMDIKDLHYAYEQDPNFRVAIHDNDQLRIRIGVGANVKAIIDAAKITEE